MRKLLLLCILTALTLTACSESKISKEEALTILKQEVKRDCTQRLSDAYYKNDRNYNSIVKMVKDLEKQGYLRVKQYGYGVEYFPTEKAKRYKVSGKTYRVATASVQDIVAIAHNEDGTATVRFSYKYEQLPLFSIRKSGSFFNKTNKRDCNMEVQEGTVVFKKFDTGWKIE